jgi:hypothetical protein
MSTSSAPPSISARRAQRIRRARLVIGIVVAIGVGWKLASAFLQ